MVRGGGRLIIVAEKRRERGRGRERQGERDGKMTRWRKIDGEKNRCGGERWRRGAQSR